jgi:hypothetical protein
MWAEFGFEDQDMLLAELGIHLGRIACLERWQRFYYAQNLV